MIAVIFEVLPASGQRDAYLELAAGLKNQLEEIDGFISIERFQSLAQPENCCPCRSGVTSRPWPSGATWNATARRRPGAAVRYLPTTGCG